MSQEKTGGPAFPYVIDPAPRADGLGRDIKIVEGQSLLDHFAGLAMQAMHASPALLEVVTSGDILDGSVDEKVARKSYDIAAAMIAERNRIMNEKP